MVSVVNILFLTIGLLDSIRQHGVYPDLLRRFIEKGHNVFAVCSREKRFGLPTDLIDEGNAKLLKVRIGNITKTNFIEKGISTLLIEKQYIAAIKKYFSKVKFDLIIYTTPPITLVGVIEYIKKRDAAMTYLMLKDIFPQNAIDLGIMSVSGFRGFVYRYFRKIEKRLYYVSDYIGCMSDANIDYIITNNPWINKQKIELCPNCTDAINMTLSLEEKLELRKHYNLPFDKKVFVYGGNLGKPQGIPFIIECLKLVANLDAFFFIVGNGTDYYLLEDFVKTEKPKNIRILRSLPKPEYDRMIAACDIGLIFLEHRFTIPNFPSRLLDYMQAELPVLACTDKYTDVGKVIVNGDFGWWCESDSPEKFYELVKQLISSDFTYKGKKAKDYLLKYYPVEKAYLAIEKHLNKLNY